MGENKTTRDGLWPAIIIFSFFFGGLPGFIVFETESYLASFFLGWLFSIMILGGIYTLSK
tara:strand:- start:14240 stop:14419 length:180 start_codon:yes stop_codon:yes gene_type:complete